MYHALSVERIRDVDPDTSSRSGEEPIEEVNKENRPASSTNSKNAGKGSNLDSMRASFMKKSDDGAEFLDNAEQSSGAPLFSPTMTTRIGLLILGPILALL